MSLLPDLMRSDRGSASGRRDPFLGKAIEIAIVTRDVQRTMAGLWKMGIGPWRVYTFSPETMTNQTYRGAPSAFVMRVCFAEQGDLIWELIEPVSCPTIFAEFLDRHGEGLHHIAFDCNNVPFPDRIAEFERRGFAFVQGGSWMGRNHFAFFETEEAITTCFETYVFPDDWEYPEPEAWFPANIDKMDPAETAGATTGVDIVATEGANIR